MSHTLERLLGEDACAPPLLAGITVTGVTADSRAVLPGFVFVAISGSQTDGNKYVGDAVARGAVAVITGSPTAVGMHHTISVENPRLTLARLAARFYGEQPETIVAVTGTNGKTSVAVFVRQIWEQMGFRAASLGTIGVVGPGGTSYLQNTTPDPVRLHELVSQLRADQVKHLAIEASSHGLAQYRLDGLQLTAAAFTNLTHDHLDYHETLDTYFAAKMRLFEELLPQGAAAVINMDTPRSAEVMARARARGLVTFGVGREGKDLRFVSTVRAGLEQHITLDTSAGRQSLTLPLVGEFQISNALVAAGLVVATGGELQLALHALQSLKGAPGRLELVGRSDKGVSAFVDYAHTPDALETAIRALKPFAAKRLAVVFGCGGDRDRAKRPIMGEIATRLADHVIVTDDNPRSEEAKSIRNDILVGAHNAIDIGNRAHAIRAGIETLGAGDILLVAGKGHEPGQIVGNSTLPFSDHEAVLAALRGVDYHAQ